MEADPAQDGYMGLLHASQRNSFWRHQQLAGSAELVEAMTRRPADGHEFPSQVPKALPERCRKAVIIADGRRALAQAIFGFLRDAALRIALRSAARSIALQEFSGATLAARYQDAV